jgi:hypothetical protein
MALGKFQPVADCRQDILSVFKGQVRVRGVGELRTSEDRANSDRLTDDDVSKTVGVGRDHVAI